MNSKKHVAIVGSGRESLPYFWVSAPEIWAVKYVTLALVKAGYKIDKSYWCDDVNTCISKWADGTYELLRDWPYKDTQLVLGNNFEPTPLPHVETFDILDFATKTGSDYINNSGAMALCDAIREGYEVIDLHGFDFVIEDDKLTTKRIKELRRQAECVAYWIGYARAKGIKVAINPMSPLCESKFRALHGISCRGIPFYKLGNLPTTNKAVHSAMLMRVTQNDVADPAEPIVNTLIEPLMTLDLTKLGPTVNLN